MRVISVHVTEEPYQRLKSLAARAGRPAAELVREAMQEFLARGTQGAEVAPGGQGLEPITA